MVLRLAALFSLDSFGGGFAVQSILALWLFRRFDFSLGEAGALFFGMGLLAALLAGALLESAWLGWPLLIGGVLKLAYDGLLLVMFRRVSVVGDRA